MLKGNKGEWSEIFVFFKLLVEGKIYAADERLNKIEKMYFPVLKILREEKEGFIYEYLIDKKIQIYFNGNEIKKVEKAQVEIISDELISVLKNKRIKSSFSIENVEKFMEEMFCTKISAPSGKKNDILMQIRDITTGYENIVGFSVKSELGAAPTLLNASKATNFIYSIPKTNNLLSIDKINNMYNEKGQRDVKSRVKRIFEENELKFLKTNKEIFSNNLVLIDSCMDSILSKMLIYYYKDDITKCEDLIKIIEEENPLNFGNKYAYRYKFKKFLAATALGMKPSEEWNGIDEVTGGYVIVTETGNVVAYHIYNRNFFEEYLLLNTKFETASTSRHGFGEIYEENGNQYFNLNLQIRFL